MAMSYKDRWTGAYSNGLSFLGKLCCPVKKKKLNCGLEALRLIKV
jgi:hypothetical protein